MAYTPPKITAQISVRVALASKIKAEGIRRVWQEISRVKRENVDAEGEEVEMDPSHVYRALLEERIDQEVSLHTKGLGFPALDDKKAWEELLKGIAAGLDIAAAKPKSR